MGAVRWTALFAAVDRVAAEADHAVWRGGQQTGTTTVDGEERPVFQTPHPEYSEAVRALVDAIGDAGLIVPFDWMVWEGRARYQGGAGIDLAPPRDAVRLITSVLRSERFVDGAIGRAIDDGTLLAAVDRLRRWRASGDP